MLTALYVAVAGALGSVARYLIGVGLQRVGGTGWPWGTFVVNLAGAFLIGFVMVLMAARGQLDSRLRFALTVGFLGGFTTYSAFAFETIELIERRAWGAAGLYVGATLVLAALACAGGMAAARALTD